MNVSYLHTSTLTYTDWPDREGEQGSRLILYRTQVDMYLEVRGSNEKGERSISRN